MEVDGSQRTEMDLLRALNVEVEPDGEFIRRLVRKMDNLNATNAYGRSALHIAAQKNFVNSALILLDAGARVNIRNRGDESPLHICSCFKHGTEMVRLLLTYGADINAVDSEKNTPLLNASAYQCLENVQELLKNGANVDVVAMRDITPLCCMLMKKNPEISIVQALLRAGADVNHRDASGKTSLHYIAESESVRFVPLLLAYKADVNALNYTKDTPLHLAARTKRHTVEMVRELIKAGAIVNALNLKRQSALYCAVRYANVEATRELLRNGATFNLLDCLRTPIYSGKVLTEIFFDLIRYMFIHSPDSVDSIRRKCMQEKVVYFFHKWSRPDCNLENFRDACLAEVDALRTLNCDCGKSSVWGSLNGCQECNCDTGHAIVKFLVSGRPSNFSDAFFYKLNKEFLLEIILHQMSFFEFKKSKKRVMLDWSCVKEIERYLSFQDLVLFLQRKESVMVASEVVKFFSFIKGTIPDESSSEITPPNPKRQHSIDLLKKQFGD